LYIHCIIKDGDVVSAVKEFEEVQKVTWDKYFDTAVHWSAKEMQDKPDLIFCEEFAVNSTLDKTTGKLNPDKTVLEALKEIRFNLPDTRVVILLQKNRASNEKFLQYLISLGIYDLHFVDSFGVDELKEFILGKPRNIKDVAAYLDVIDITPDTKNDAKTVFSQEEKEIESNRRPFKKLNLIDFKKRLSRISALLSSKSVESVKDPGIKTEGKPEKAKDKPLVDIPEEKVYISRNDEAKVNNIVPEIAGKLPEKASEKSSAKRSPEQILTETETANEAIYDTLTGAYNRDYFDKTVAEQIREAETQGLPFSILICDIDWLKQVNDTYGHLTGDKVLKKFTQFIKSGIRENDKIFRIGGDEFVVVFPGQEKKEVLKIARRLCDGWWKQMVCDTTISGGVAEYGDKNNDIESLINDADKALYAAKKNGRNQVHAAGMIPEPVKPFSLINKPELWRTKVYIVAGVNHRVGATSFTLALAEILSKKTEVEILDAGGGAARWLGRQSRQNSNNRIFVRQGPASSISPGIFTLVDVGIEIPEEIVPFAEGVFLVTDLSRNALNLKEFKNYRCILVGNRGANIGGLMELASLWNFNVFCTLTEDSKVKQAEIEGKIPMPGAWKKSLKNGLKIIEKGSC
jgi:diguanylate cyclase (GGDEF)-like protein